MKSKKCTLTAKILGMLTMLLISATPIVRASLSDSVLYSTDFHTSSNSISAGYTYTTNGAAGSGGTVVYVTNSHGVATQWATTTTGQDGWVSSATPNTAAGAAGPGVNDYIGSFATPYFQSYGGDTYYSTDFTNTYTYPQSATNYMFQASYANTHSNAIHFDTTFWMYGDPTTPNLNGRYDTLGWTLLNSAGNALMSINLSTTNSNAAGWNLTASSYATDGTNNQVLNKLNGTAISAIANNQLVHLGFDISGIGTAQQMITVLQYTNISSAPGGAYTVLGTNLISGYNFSGIAGGTNVAEFADTWILQDQSTFSSYTNAGVVTTGYSDYAVNSLQMASLVIAVPEPKTWILFGLSGLVLVVVLRRRAA